MNLRVLTPSNGYLPLSIIIWMSEIFVCEESDKVVKRLEPVEWRMLFSKSDILFIQQTYLLNQLDIATDIWLKKLYFFGLLSQQAMFS